MHQQYAAVPSRGLARCRAAKNASISARRCLRQNARASARSASRAARPSYLDAHASIVPSVTTTAPPPIVPATSLPCAIVEGERRSGSAGPSRSPARSETVAAVARTRLARRSGRPSCGRPSRWPGLPGCPCPARTCGHGSRCRARRFRGRTDRPGRGRQIRRWRRSARHAAALWRSRRGLSPARTQTASRPTNSRL